jgi:hypothetical protein
LFEQGLSSPEGSSSSGSKRFKIAEGAATLLGADAQLAVPPQDVEQLMLHAYELRNKEMHADHPTAGQLRQLDGSAAPSLAVVVDDVERVMPPRGAPVARPNRVPESPSLIAVRMSRSVVPVFT